MRDDENIESTPNHPRSDSQGPAVSDVFADPVSYLESFGIRAELVEPAPARLAPAA